MSPSDARISKFLSLVLRHKPEEIGLVLDAGGWADVDELIVRSGVPMDRATVVRIVAQSDKTRFALSDDGRRIRANQGHSIPVDLGLEPSAPPPILYHGTADRNLASILARGLTKQARHHVHLSPDAETARRVGLRRGSPVVLRVAAARMADAGHVFYRSDNGVWLTDHVPSAFLTREPAA